MALRDTLHLMTQTGSDDSATTRVDFSKTGCHPPSRDVTGQCCFTCGKRLWLCNVLTHAVFPTEIIHSSNAARSSTQHIVCFDLQQTPNLRAAIPTCKPTTPPTATEHTSHRSVV